MNPYNMHYTFGDDLRAHPEDIPDFKAGINYHIQQLKQEEHLKERCRLLSSIGINQAIAGLLEASLKHLLEAKKLLENSEHVQLYLINEIRLAQTYQFLKQFKKAEAIYQVIEVYIEKHPAHNNLLHVVYQHKGKNYFEQAEYALAECYISCLLYTSPSPRDTTLSRMPSSA